VLVHLCWLQLRPESELHPVLCRGNGIHGPPRSMMQHEQSDRIAGQAVDGNVLLKLAGYAKTNPVVANS